MLTLQKLLNEIRYDDFFEDHLTLASNEGTSMEKLHVLASDSNHEVRKAVAQNPNVQKATLSKLFNEFPVEVSENESFKFLILSDPGLTNFFSLKNAYSTLENVCKDLQNKDFIQKAFFDVSLKDKGIASLCISKYISNENVSDEVVLYTLRDEILNDAGFMGEAFTSFVTSSTQRSYEIKEKLMDIILSMTPDNKWVFYIHTPASIENMKSLKRLNLSMLSAEEWKMLYDIREIKLNDGFSIHPTMEKKATKFWKSIVMKVTT